MPAINGVMMYLDVSKYRWSVPQHIKDLHDRTPVSLLAVHLIALKRIRIREAGMGMKSVSNADLHLHP